MAFNTSNTEGVNFAAAIPAVSTSTPEYPGPTLAPGTRVSGSDGSEWLLTVIGTGGVTAGDFVYVSDYTTWTCLRLSNSAKALLGAQVGVAGATGTVGQYVWIQRSGYAPTSSVATSAAANTAMHTTSTSGRLSTTATGGTTGGVSGVVITATAASNIGLSVLNWPTIGAAD